MIKEQTIACSEPDTLCFAFMLNVYGLRVADAGVRFNKRAGEGVKRET
jgi:hypothetical protein